MTDSSLRVAGPTPDSGRGLRGALRNLSPFGVVTLCVVAGLAFLAIYPLGRVVVRLFWVDGAPTLEPFRKTLAEPALPSLIFNTVVVVVVSSVLAVLIGSALAWLNERTNARIGVLTDALPLVPFLIPPVAGAIGWVLLLSPRAGYLNGVLRTVLGWFGVHVTEGPLDIYSWWGLIFVFTIFSVPFAFLMVSAGLRNLDPSLEEQARISGSGVFKTFKDVTLPALAPSIGGAALLMAWQGFALFSVPAIIGSPAGIDLLSVRIVRLLSFTYPAETDVAIGLSFIVAFFVAIAWVAQVRILRRGRYATLGGKSRKATPLALGAWRWPARLLMIGYFVVAAVLPVVALLLVSLTGFWSTTIRWGSLSLNAFQEHVFGNRQTYEALTNSLSVSAITSTVAMVAAAIASLYLLRARGLAARGVDLSIKLPAVVPNLVIAVGFLLAFAGAPFFLNGTLLILGLAYLALYIPQGSVATDAAAGQVGVELAEASRISGAGRGRTFRKVHLPLMVGGIAAGWALLFARMIGDLQASALLSGTRNPVVGFRILDTYDNGSYAALAALTMVLTAITLFVVTLMFILQRRNLRWAVSNNTG